MKKILVINGSVSVEQNSYSLALTNRFIKEYQTNHPDDSFEFLDLNTLELAQKTLTRETMNTYWDQATQAQIDKLKQVDKIIISSPMNNFNVSGLIKNYLDHILLANETFSYKYSKKGDAIGLLTNLTVQIITTQGAPLGWYPWGNHTEFLKGTWEFVGAKVNTPILLAGTKTSPIKSMTIQEAIDSIQAKIIDAVETF